MTKRLSATVKLQRIRNRYKELGTLKPEKAGIATWWVPCISKELGSIRGMNIMLTGTFHRQRSLLIRCTYLALLGGLT